MKQLRLLFIYKVAMNKEHLNPRYNWKFKNIESQAKNFCFLNKKEYNPFHKNIRNQSFFHLNMLFLNFYQLAQCL